MLYAFSQLNFPSGFQNPSLYLSCMSWVLLIRWLCHTEMWGKIVMSLSDLIIDHILPEIEKDSFCLIFKSAIRTWKMSLTVSLDHRGWRGELDGNWSSRVGTAGAVTWGSSHNNVKFKAVSEIRGPGYGLHSSPPSWCLKQLSSTHYPWCSHWACVPFSS